MAHSESRFNPAADNGEDRGLFQINRISHPEVSDECAFDPECASRWSAKQIKTGRSYEWVAANCYLLAMVMVKKDGYKLPLSKDLKPNSTPAEGTVAIFNYNGVMHYAYVVSLGEKTFRVYESNYIPGLIEYRDVSYADKSLTGYWSPHM